MSEHIKTGKEIWNEIERDYHQISCSRDFEQEERVENLEKKKYLPIPEGLDALEKMLNEKFAKEGYCDSELYKHISSVFARFKKETGL